MANGFTKFGFRFATALGAALLTFCSCTEEPVQPPPKPPVHVQQDTTSHEVTWEIFRFGRKDIEVSILRDIYALNDTDIWAVGEIKTDDYMTTDSTGKFVQPYNAVHWDGREWTLLNISADTTRWGERAFRHLYCIWVFGHNHLVAYDGGMQWWNENRVHWRGIKYWRETIPIGTYRGLVNKIWATSPEDYYLAGDNGSLTHFSDGKFKLIETGTEGLLNDIYGTNDGQIYTGGWDSGKGIRSFLYVHNDIAKPVGSTLGGANTMYISNDTIYAHLDVSGGSGFFMRSARDTTAEWRYVLKSDFTVQHGFLEEMRGLGDNNIFAVGHFQTIIHYNGKSWKLLDMYDPTGGKVIFKSVTVTQEHVYIAGLDNSTGQAVIYKGTLR